jgi:hypothetical protein
MKLITGAAFVVLSALIAHADITIGKFDLKEIRDVSTLETKVIEDWHPNPKDATIRQKLVEITVCEWWPGMKVRMPVTMLAPAKGVCTNVLIENTSAQLKVTAASGAKLRLLKEHGVGLVFIGCVPIDTMEPVGKLHLDDGGAFHPDQEHALHTRVDLGHQRHARAHHRDRGERTCFSRRRCSPPADRSAASPPPPQASRMIVSPPSCPSSRR